MRWIASATLPFGENYLLNDRQKRKRQTSAFGSSLYDDKSHHRIIDTQMTGYEKATLTLASFKTSDVGE
jgi:hypothetical protein